MKPFDFEEIGKNIGKLVQLKTWDELKQQGSEHYKTGGIEPIDLYRASGTFHDWAISNIQKYAFRNRKELVGNKINPKDMKKIIHLAELLMACYETEKESQT